MDILATCSKRNMPKKLLYEQLTTLSRRIAEDIAKNDTHCALAIISDAQQTGHRFDEEAAAFACLSGLGPATIFRELGSVISKGNRSVAFAMAS
jgi:hypothetical protein